MREEISDSVHEIWINWMKYLFEFCNEVGDGCMEIPREKVDRWYRQMDTPYSQLSEDEKDSDREQADKIIAVLSKINNDRDYEKELRDTITLFYCIVKEHGGKLTVRDETIASMANDAVLHMHYEPENRQTVYQIEDKL